MEDPNKYMKVQCISIGKHIFSLVQLGKIYFMDRDTLYIDMDGKVYGTVYDESMKKIGKLPHVHFKSVD